MDILANEILTRLEALETHQAFQDVTIEELNQTIIQHEKDISRLKEQLRQLSEKLKASSTSLIAPLSEEVPPPHY